MFNSFASALLASVAIAVGDGNGLGQDNAVTTQLLKTDVFELTLNSYNSDNGGTYEFHGDLTAKIAGNSKAYQQVKFGFCMKPFDDSMDCLVSTASVDTERIADDPVFGQDFTVEDSYQPGAGIAYADIKKDAKFEIQQADTNFLSIPAKSRKGCTGVKKAAGIFEITCTDLNLHYYRNFITTEKTQDGQLSLDLAGTKLPFYGFIETASDADFSARKLQAVGEVVEIAPVTTAFKAAVEKSKDGTDGGSNGGSDGGSTGEDSASSMTAAIVAVSALAALF